MATRREEVNIATMKSKDKQRTGEAVKLISGIVNPVKHDQHKADEMSSEKTANGVKTRRGIKLLRWFEVFFHFT